MAKKKVEIEGSGPIWRDPRRNSVQKAVPGVPYGGMATHLVTKRCDFGSLGVPGPASTPLGPGPSLGPGPCAGGRRAVAPTQTPLVSTHPPKIAIPLLGGMSHGPGQP